MIISKIKKLVLGLFGNYNHLKKRVKFNHAWYGNTYGGFYLCPEFLNTKSIVYSFGIGEDVSFDLDVIKNHNCNVFGFDPTPKSKKYIEDRKLNEKFIFYEFGISNMSGIIDFYLPNNPKHISGSVITQKNVNIETKINVEMKSLNTIMSELGHEHIDVLKMDIEGSEYDVLENILNENISISQILVEFHDRFFENGNLKSKQIVNKLNIKGFQIFAISDTYEEISFINTKHILNKIDVKYQ